jgi:geranylgeranyl diphosphate synthase type II
MSGSLSAEPMERYHEMKTGALFRLAAEAGAVAAGAANPKSWGEVGRLIGKWYQLADDWMDVYGQQALLGKPTGQDATHGRPNAVLSRGEVAVRTELSLLLKSVEQRVSALCGDAGPLLSFLSALHLQILKVMGVDHV